MSQWFGTSWGALVNMITEQVPVPVGQHCLHCREDIVLGDSGIVLPNVNLSVAAYFHYECWFRMIVGSVGHLLKVCSCFYTGADAFDDPDGMTEREAARAALNLFLELRSVNKE